MKPLTKRVAEVLNQKKTRKAQEQQMLGMPEKDPRVELLDHLYENLSDEDTEQALNTLYKLTSAMDLQDDVAFEVLNEEHPPHMAPSHPVHDTEEKEEPEKTEEPSEE